MTKQEFMALMQYPKEWELWQLYPDRLFTVQIKDYEPGSENASEHFRNGAFHWWLRQEPSADVLSQLAKLTCLDPDLLMGEDVRRYIVRSRNFDSTVTPDGKPES